MNAERASIGDRVFVVPTWHWRTGDPNDLAEASHAAVVVADGDGRKVARRLHAPGSVYLNKCECTWSAALEKVHATVVEDLMKCAAAAGMLAAKIQNAN